MNLNDITAAPKPRQPARALIGTDATGVPVVLATDDGWLEEEVDNVGTNAEDVGIRGLEACIPAGLYLFTGHSRLTYDLESGKPDGSEWVGDLRPVRPEEVAELYAMEPPAPPSLEGPDDAHVV
jgi:hypothetical protein